VNRKTLRTNGKSVRLRQKSQQANRPVTSPCGGPLLRFLRLADNRRALFARATGRSGQVWQHETIFESMGPLLGLCRLI
jgi:hypothetical protein